MSGLVIALSGGIGGAKLALGLARVLPADELLVVANTGDDFEHLGLSISPDIDTVMYTLSGLSNPDLGWGRRDETWSFMQTLATLGGEDWFRLGDRDLALHVERTRRLRGGETLSAITADLCARLGVACRVVPMSDQPVRTRPAGSTSRIISSASNAARWCANWRSRVPRRPGRCRRCWRPWRAAMCAPW
jgi:LPPG:FO 2-phospho-L-lactate transferase